MADQRKKTDFDVASITVRSISRSIDQGPWQSTSAIM